jgi:hypothetical protein
MNMPPDPGSRDDLLNHIGRLSQIGGITSLVHAEGKAKGTCTLRVRTARGLEFWVVPDRGMDIFEASFGGRSLVWHSPTGMVHPSFYSNRGLEWLKTFAGGLLTTCGLTAAGAPSEDQGESFGLHGSISNTPAERVRWSEDWDGEDCVFTVAGAVREAAVHGPNLLLERTISTTLRSASIRIRDTVENQGTRESPLMLLYHINFGFPLLTEKSEIHAPSRAVEPANELSARSKDKWHLFETAVKGADERVYFHSMEPDAEGRVSVVLVSDRQTRAFGLLLRYDCRALPEFVEWKMTAANHFVLGLEPGNCRSTGRSAERARGALQMIAPGEKRTFEVELTVLDGQDEVERAIASAG